MQVPWRCWFCSSSYQYYWPLIVVHEGVEVSWVVTVGRHGDFPVVLFRSVSSLSYFGADIVVGVVVSMEAMAFSSPEKFVSVEV